MNKSNGTTKQSGTQMEIKVCYIRFFLNIYLKLILFSPFCYKQISVSYFFGCSFPRAFSINPFFYNRFVCNDDNLMLIGVIFWIY